MVSVDTTGIVELANFNKFIRWSVEHQRLLDGSSGQVVAVDALIPPKRGATTGRSAATQAMAFVDGLGTILAISTRRSTFLIGLEPRPTVLHKWPAPEGARRGGSWQLAG